ncbi:hypothetical protein ASG11_06705 [Sphingomonas sp. Leaf357]|nr:hypothetical protein ASG11_06705 [Sphingomonas sp. Leaf357]
MITQLCQTSRIAPLDVFQSEIAIHWFAAAQPFLNQLASSVGSILSMRIAFTMTSRRTDR